jgi:CHAT domain-containing protein/tetratricopeptide (TPR) repeat protein
MSWAGAVTCACLATALAGADTRGRSALPQGIVVEEVGSGGTAARGGLRPGDVLLSWTCRVGDKAQRGDPRGTLGSPFDLADIDAAQGPAGAVAVSGRRGGRPLTAILAPGEWDLRVRPAWGPDDDRSYEEARRLLAAEEPDAGVAHLREHAEAARSRGRADLAAWLLLKAAEALAARERWDAARQTFAEAKAASGTEVHKAVVAEAEATALAGRRPELAEAALREALDIRRALPHRSLAAAGDLNRLARLYYDRGDRRTAATLYNEALALAEATLPDTLVTAQSLTMLQVADPEAYGAHGEPGEGFHRGLAIRQRLAPESLGMAQSLILLGGGALRRGDLGKAREWWSRALEIQQRVQPGGPHQSWTLNNLGLVATEQGDYQTAEDLLRRALALKEKVNPRSLEVATVLNNVGLVAMQRGDDATAEALFLRALALADEVNPQSTEGMAPLSNLVELTLKAGDFRKAEGWQARVLAFWEDFAPKSIEMGVALMWQARIVSRAGDHRRAEELLERGLPLLPPNSLRASDAWQVLADVTRSRKELEKAAEHYARALGLRTRWSPGSGWEAESLHELALVRREQGRLEEALGFSGRAVAALDQQRGRLGGSHEARSRFGAAAAAAYRNHLDLLLEKGDEAGAFHALERFRARAFLQLLAERDVDLTAGTGPEQERERRILEAEYDRVQASIAEPGADVAPDELEATLRRLREIGDRREALVGRLRRESPRMASVRYPVPLDLPGARAVLDPGTVLLSYVVEPTRTLLFVVEAAGQAGGGLTVFVLPVAEPRLRQTVESYRRAMAKGPAGDRQALQRQASELYTLLVAPAEKHLAPAARVVISPDGPLHLLPFAALVRQDQPLVGWRPVHVTPSVTAYGEILKGRTPGGRGWERDLVAFGDPLHTYERPGDGVAAPAEEPRRGRRLEPIPFARREAHALGALFPFRSRVFVGASATEEQAKTALRNVRYVHFACHGLLDRRLPLDSALALASPRRSGPRGENGLLQAWEILEQVRLDADLVTMSACESGLGTEMSGEGLLGLTRAFLHAGARSVVASLWSVSDRSTADVMERFYRRLANGEPKDEALRAAQLEMIRAGGPRSHPFYWAAFHLVGDWR